MCVQTYVCGRLTVTHCSQLILWCVVGISIIRTNMFKGSGSLFTQFSVCMFRRLKVPCLWWRHCNWVSVMVQSRLCSNQSLKGCHGNSIVTRYSELYCLLYEYRMNVATRYNTLRTNIAASKEGPMETQSKSTSFIVAGSFMCSGATSCNLGDVMICFSYHRKHHTTSGFHPPRVLRLSTSH